MKARRFEEIAVAAERGEIVVVAVDNAIADRLRVPVLAQVWIEPTEDPRVVTMVFHEPDGDA